MKHLVFIVINLLLINIVFSENYITHKIKKGETIWRISKSYNVSVEDICRLNNISDVANVRYGETIKIPGKSDINKNQNYKIHVIQKDETLWRISKKYGISVDDICSVNNIKDITKIKSGTKIKIPYNVEYLDYKIPADGEIKPFITSHFIGIHIFTGTDKAKRKVTAVDNGQVSYIDNVPGYGLTVFIRHLNGLVSTYSGFEEVYIKTNDIIKNGQVIGLAGNLSRFDKYGLLFSIQFKGNGLRFDMEKKQFIKNSI